jgi:hypothetical protein
MNTHFPSRLSDNELIAEIPKIVGSERASTATLIAHLAEFEARDLHLALGYSSLFVYCQEALHYTEEESYLRMSAARLARKFPLVVARLSDGSVSLTALRLLASHLQSNNYEELLTAASWKTKHEVQELVAALAPRPDTPLTIRDLPVPAAAPPAPAAADTPALGASPASPPAPAERTSLKPLSPGRQQVSLTMSTSTIAKLNHARDLLQHAIPNRDAGDVIDRALTLLIKDIERKRWGITDRPQPSRRTKPGSPYVPAAVRRAVWKRDGGRCAFVGKTGHRCTATACLQNHHVDPGGPSTVENLQLRCAAHNRYEGALVYGRTRMRSYVGVVKEGTLTWSGPSTPAGLYGFTNASP